MIYYTYPGTPKFREYNNVDFGLKLAYDFGVAAPYVGFRYSPDYFGASGHAELYTAGVVVPVPFAMVKEYGVKLMGEIDKQNISKNARFGTPDYTYWMAGITANVFTLDFTLAYYDTNIARAQCSGGLTVCDSRVVFSVGKAF